MLLLLNKSLVCKSAAAAAAAASPLSTSFTSGFRSVQLPRPPSSSALFRTTRLSRPCYGTQLLSMAVELRPHKANLCIQEVAGHTTELLELLSDNPSVHVLLVPGNPGCVVFYRDYVESLFRCLDGKASITVICHVAHTSEDWEGGKVFSLEEQIDHKVHFLKGFTKAAKVPIVLLGHSVGAHISLQLLRQFPNKVDHVLGLFPFLTVNRESLKQQALFKICKSPPMTAGLSSFAGLLGSSPRWFTIPFVKSTIGWHWGTNALHSAYSHLLKCWVIRNMTYMGATEYKQMQIPPDWDFLRKNQKKISLLFGSNDHWGPLSLCKELSSKVPNLTVAVENEGLLHDFACNEAGSNWVAQFTADVTMSSIQNL